MKKILFPLLLFPLLSSAQETQPRFENDTLYTTSGYKIYEGQVLQLAKGTSAAGYFRFIKFHTNMARTDTYTLQDGSILVKKLKNYKNSGSDKLSIRIEGTVTYKNGSKAETDIIMEFEKATQSPDRLPNELTVPEEFLVKQTITENTAPVKQEVKRQTEPVAESKRQDSPADLKKIMVADEIKKLFDLYKSGALTKEEYEAQKKKLLERQ